MVTIQKSYNALMIKIEEYSKVNTYYDHNVIIMDSLRYFQFKSCLLSLWQHHLQLYIWEVIRYFVDILDTSTSWLSHNGFTFHQGGTYLSHICLHSNPVNNDTNSVLALSRYNPHCFDNDLVDTWLCRLKEVVLDKINLLEHFNNIVKGGVIWGGRY